MRPSPSTRYVLLCAALGLCLAWIPSYLHGPIHQKFDLFALRGTVAVWCWYLARGTIGLLVGITRWPTPWWLRGALCGSLMLLPPGMIALATPGCGPT